MGVPRIGASVVGDAFASTTNDLTSEAEPERLMAVLARMVVDDVDSILLEVSNVEEGPIKAGRISEAIHDLPDNLQAALGPVTKAAKVALDQLRQAGPSEVEIEFGVDLSVQAGAVITKGGAGCHLRVTMTWRGWELEERR